MKRSAIICFNHRCYFDYCNVTSLESIGIYNYLTLVKQEDTYVVSNKIKEAKSLDFYLDYKTTDLNEFDKIYIHNSPKNFYGGSVKEWVTKQIKELSTFKGEIYSIFTDPAIPMYDFATEIYERQDTNLKLFDSLKLTQEDVLGFKSLNIKAIFTGTDYNKYLSQLDKDKHWELNEVEYWPLFEFLHINKVPFEFDLSNKDNYNLVYYGNLRNKYRKDKVNSFFSNGLSKLTIGFDLERKDVKSEGYMRVDDLYSQLRFCDASISIGDKLHNGNWVTFRFFENINNELINFIDIEYDPEMRLIENEYLRSILYVKDGKQLENNFNKIIGRKAEIVSLQNEELNKYKHLKYDNYKF